MANLTDALADLAITRSLVLQRVSNGLSEQVAGAYNVILDDIDKAIKTATPIQLKNMRATISELKTRVAPELDFVKKDLGDLAITEAGYFTGTTNTIVGADIFSKVVKDSTLVNIANTSLIEGATTKDWFTSLNKSMQTDMERAIKLGVSIGETNHELAKRVDTVLNKGINHAKAITRTSVATVSNQARQAVYDANDDVIKGYEHLSTLDSKTSFVCAGRDGAMWDKDGKGLNAQGKKNKYRVPPLHFNCRSLLIPVTKTWSELGFTGVGKVPQSTRSSIDGEISSGTNFEKWIKGKSPQFQKDYLGAGRYQLWKDKKITFSDLVNQQGQTLSISELRGKTPIVKKPTAVKPKPIGASTTVSFGYGGKFDKHIIKVTDSAKVILSKIPQPQNIVVGKGHYSPRFKRVSTPLRDTRVFYHEYGHYIDNHLSSKDMEFYSKTRLYEASTKDAKNLGLFIEGVSRDGVKIRQASLSKFADEMIIKVDMIGQRGRRKGLKIGYKYTPKEDYLRGISDIIDSMSDGWFYDKHYGSGHGGKYYFMNRENKMTENFANMFQLWSDKDTRGWKKAKELFPNLSKEFELIMQEVQNG